MEDKEIICLYQQRDESAIAQTDTKYHRYCHTVSYNILKNEEDSEECVSDTWLKAWNTIPPTVPKLLSAFLAKITRNLSLDRYRSLHAARRGGELAVIDTELDTLGCDTMEERLDAMVLTEVLEDFLRNEPRESRVIFLRRYWYCDSIAQIAKRRHCSESRVKSALFRTRNRLKAMLEQEGVCL